LGKKILGSRNMQEKFEKTIYDLKNIFVNAGIWYSVKKIPFKHGFATLA
jgi:hypothetical protein